VVVHARGGGDDDPPIIVRDPARTATELARRDYADGENCWRAVEFWQPIKSPPLGAMLAFPPGAPDGAAAAHTWHRRGGATGQSVGPARRGAR